MLATSTSAPQWSPMPGVGVKEEVCLVREVESVCV